MKSYFHIMICLFFAAGPFSVCAAPLLNCDDPICDFGMLSDSDRIEHTFVLRNDGDEDLVVGKIRACCGGTVEIVDRIIQPGSNTTLTAKLSLAGRRGRLRKAYYVRSNDPVRPIFKLTFTGSIAVTNINALPEWKKSARNLPRGAAASHPLGVAPPRVRLAPAGNAPPEVLARMQEPPEPAVGQPAIDEASRVVIDYFFEEGCAECAIVNEQVLPRLERRFPGQYVLKLHNVADTSNVVSLITYQEALGITKDESVLMVIDYVHVLNGVDSIIGGVTLLTEQALSDRRSDGVPEPQPITVPTLDTAVVVAENRMGRFTWTAMASAGLIDGINPCAIGTLVFFMSLLAVSRIRGPKLLAVGIPFCMASFLTYFAIGLGLLAVLRSFAGLPHVQSVVEIAMSIVLSIFALLSFRDAYRYHRSGDSSDVSLQLPDSIKQRIRGILRAGLNTTNLALGATAAGFLVTILESICTGQLYLPTLVLVARHGPSSATALSLLALYNVAFILPLVVVFTIAYQGIKTDRLIEWSRRNVVPSKTLLGLVFVALCVLIWIT